MFPIDPLLLATVRVSTFAGSATKSMQKLSMRRRNVPHSNRLQPTTIISARSPDWRSQLNIPKGVTGAVVTEVEPDSPAAEAGLKSGDIIQEINRHPVKNADDAVKLTEEAKDKRTLVRVWENGGSRYLVVDETQKAG